MTRCCCGVIINMELPFVTRETRHTAAVCEPIGRPSALHELQEVAVAQANARQVGGDHHHKKIQTWDFIVAQEIGSLEGNAIKYIARHKDKGGKGDLEKAIHYLQKAIEVYYK